MCLINDKFIIQVKWVDGQNGVHVQLPVMKERRPEQEYATLQEASHTITYHTIWGSIAMVWKREIAEFVTVNHVNLKAILVRGLIGVHVQ